LIEANGESLLVEGHMHNLISFYLKESPNSDGRYLEEIWEWPDADWELQHDFIQWLFPLEQPSAFNADAPLLDEDTIKEWHRDKLLQHNLRQSSERWLRFCGVESVEGNLHLADFKQNVWGGFNHNWLRITRVMRCLRLLGLKSEATELFAFLGDLRASKRVEINDEPFGFWTRAVEQ
jgi:hypothetical protein